MVVRLFVLWFRLCLLNLVMGIFIMCGVLKWVSDCFGGVICIGWYLNQVWFVVIFSVCVGIGFVLLGNFWIDCQFCQENLWLFYIVMNGKCVCVFWMFGLSRQVWQSVWQLFSEFGMVKWLLVIFWLCVNVIGNLMMWLQWWLFLTWFGVCMILQKKLFRCSMKLS